jgi:hypothetical protein
LQKLFSFRVVTLLVGKTMLATIEFNGQFCFLTKEIQTVNAERMLATEFIANEPPITQPVPHEFFRPRFLFAKLPGAFNIGHAENLENEGKTEKLVFVSALTLTLSPGERE